ncbi:hypothetical protein DE146DRAFT_790590 [Phaeosphaeria sp. MPI-PUGE-AT-0046c]|nr:hypothetical protein DE146DRAFT_790590 [Phaeosphaeria sp. MPI-PUGE-AT-0046c]
MKYSAISFILGALPLLQVDATPVVPVAPRSAIPMPDAQRVIPDFEPLAKQRELPAPKVTVDLSTDYWEGRVYHYNTTNSTGHVEEFTVSIIEGGVDLEEEPTSTLLAPGVSPRDGLTSLRELSKRQWYCDWIYGCIDAVAYAAFVSANQIDAAVNVAGEYLRANNFGIVARAVKGGISTYAVLIGSGVVTFYVTNKIQGQNVQATDSCESKKYNNIISQLAGDLRQCLKQVQEGDSRPKRWDHISEEKDKRQEGFRLVHTTKPTKNKDDYKNINSC